MTYFQGKIIVVTGGCGSIGSEIVAQLLTQQPKEIRVFDNNEYGQFLLSQKHKQDRRIRYILGSVTDLRSVCLAVSGADIVFHSAALKHVPFCEINPVSAVDVNVNGTINVVEASLTGGVKDFVGISTDKAVNPINTMGATKLLAEKIIINANHQTNCIFSVVRFGNVLNSSGSVIPIFREQIDKGGPVTVTHPDMVRFFMSLGEAVELVLAVCRVAIGGEIFILKMKEVRINDIAFDMIHESGKDILIQYTGVRRGEKIKEILMTEEEEKIAISLGDMWILPNLPT